jgi:hypothetical protein
VLKPRDRTLAMARQGDLETWLASVQATHRTDAGNFVRWARRHKLTSLDFAAIRWGGPTGVIDTEARWEQARWLLHDSTLNPATASPACSSCSTPNGQPRSASSPSAISRPAAGRCASGSAASRSSSPSHSTPWSSKSPPPGEATPGGGDQGTSPWLFPGGQPGRPISAFRLAERLRQLGIRSGPSRSAALFQLATDLPAAALARMLGIHIAVAVAWQRAAAGDWASYAADVSRRHPHLNDQPATRTTPPPAS